MDGGSKSDWTQLNRVKRTASSFGRSSATRREAPLLVVVAGPNGSGKSTLTSKTSFGVDLAVMI